MSRRGLLLFARLTGIGSTGLFAFVSTDGFRWSKIHDKVVITKGAFDSQNVPFWSESEKSGSDVGKLAGTPVRLRFVMRDARLFALQFRE